MSGCSGELWVVVEHDGFDVVDLERPHVETLGLRLEVSPAAFGDETTLLLADVLDTTILCKKAVLSAVGKSFWCKAFGFPQLCADWLRHQIELLEAGDGWPVVFWYGLGRAGDRLIGSCLSSLVSVPPRLHRVALPEPLDHEADGDDVDDHTNLPEEPFDGDQDGGDNDTETEQNDRPEILPGLVLPELWR